MSARRGFALEAGLFVAAAACLVAGFHRPAYVAKPFVLVAPEAGVVRMVTWNVGSTLDAGGRPLASDDLDHVVDRLRELDADLLFVQEMRDGRQVRRLQRRLGGDWDYALATDAGTSCVAVLGRGGLVPFRAPAANGRVVGAVAELEKGIELAVMVVHADAFSSEERNATLGAAADALMQRDEAARVFAGDLNLDLDLGKRRDLFTDDEYLDVETYNYVARSLLDAGSGTGSTAEPDRRLDYVFVSSDTLRVVRAGPWKGQRIGSMDHDPLVADVIRR